MLFLSLNARKTGSWGESNPLPGMTAKNPTVPDTNRYTTAAIQRTRTEISLKNFPKISH